MNRKELLKQRDQRIKERFFEEYAKQQFGSDRSKTDIILDQLKCEFWLMPSYMYRIIFAPHHLRRNSKSSTDQQL